MSEAWRIACASVIGTSHVKNGTPCQDAAQCRILTDSQGRSVVCAVVSDGAGSASRSEDGARMATEVIMGALDIYLGRGSQAVELELETVAEWIAAARSAIEMQAQNESLTPRDFACTLLAAVISDEGSAFFQVGDGAMVIGDLSGGDWAYVFWPQHGEFANTTYFITEPGFRDHVQFMATTAPVGEFAVFSDGIERLVLDYARKDVHAPFFSKMFGVVRQSGAEGLDEGLSASLASYLGSAAVCERTDDDKSLILGTRLAAGG